MKSKPDRKQHNLLRNPRGIGQASRSCSNCGGQKSRTEANQVSCWTWAIAARLEEAWGLLSTAGSAKGFSSFLYKPVV